MLASGVLIAHSEIAHERRIDQLVIRSFRVERVLTVLGVLLIVIGYGMEIYFYGFTDLLTCTGDECAAMLSASVTGN